jgi:hypothetical protein
MPTSDLPLLNYPEYTFRIENRGGALRIFDPVRKKMVSLTPEEWVRQHTISYLIEHKGYPINLIGVEKKLSINSLTKRFDLVAFSKNGQPLILIECKAPQIQISQKVFDQAARYNLSLGASFFLITNGLQHYCCYLDALHGKYSFIAEVPDYSSLKLR